MRVLVNGATPTVRKYAGRYPAHLGHLVQPRSGNRVVSFGTGLPWAADNGAIAGFDADAFRRMLDSFDGLDGCLFVAAPDHIEKKADGQLVGDCQKTSDLFERWYPEMAAQGLPVALVAQDGLTVKDLPHSFFHEHPMLKAVFVGGSTEYKLSPQAREVRRVCRLMGLWVHVGRVNSRVRMHQVRSWRADSCDGTCINFGPDLHLPRFLQWAAEADEVTDARRGFGPVVRSSFQGYRLPRWYVSTEEKVGTAHPAPW